MTTYQETRNGLIGTDYSTKLSAFLAMGCISARSIHDELVKFEDGTERDYSKAMGFGQGENEGTRAVRFELLWRDYMRLCTMKYGVRLFKLDGFKGANGNYDKKWNTPNEEDADPDQNPPPKVVAEMINRFIRGTTGMGLVDASSRELYHTGYTSNRARQNAASFLTKHLGVDWRIGASIYEAFLIDFDVNSNHSNWQYIAGCGNDPRSNRSFNPVKQAFDYDNDGKFCRTWCWELREITKLEHVFQLCTALPEELEKHGLTNNIMVTNPLKRIEFSVDRKPRGSRRPYRWKRAGGRGGNNRRGDSGNSSGNGDFNGNYRNGPSSPPNTGDTYMQNNGQSRSNWAPRGNSMSWRGNSNGYGPNNHGLPGRGHIPFQGNSFQQGYTNNAYHHPPRQYMPGPGYSQQQQYVPHAYHQQLPPHM
jgi:deoxyribodipyrimidine photo-lyase